MSRQPLGSDSPTKPGVTFEGNLQASAPVVNLLSVWIISFVWPRQPGAPERRRDRFDRARVDPVWWPV